MPRKEVSPRTQEIVRQYRQITGAMNSMFQAASPRTNLEAWRKDGIGSCKSVTKPDLEHTIGIEDQEAHAELIRLRDEKNAITEGKSTVTSCPYHRACTGCVLGDLKPQLCVRWFDNKSEWLERFNIDASDLSVDTNYALYDVMEGVTVEDPSPTERFVKRIEGITKKIEEKPILD